MKSAFKVAAAVLFLSATIVVSQASAVYVPPKVNDEDSLQDILTAKGYAINVAETACAGERFICSNPSALMIEEIAGFKDDNILSWYSPLNLTTGEIFNGAYGAGMPEQVFTPSTPFGFMLTSPEGRSFFSELALNADGYDHFWVFLNPNYVSNDPARKQYIIGIEDRWDGYDGDHNDMVFAVSGITPVPEPGTLMLLGSGLIGAVGFARRKLS